MNPPAAHPPPPRPKILVRGVNWLGDAIMTTPALLRLRQALPQAEIVLLTHIKLAGLWPHHPSINEVLTFSDSDPVFQIARSLRRQNFETALLLPNSPRSALEAWWAGIPRRIGYAARWRRWLLTDPLAHRPGLVAMHKRSTREVWRLINTPPATPLPALPATAHQIHHYLHLTATLGADSHPLAPQIFVADGEIRAAQRKFKLASDPQWPWIGLNPGAEYGPAKRWPRERFVAAALEIHRRFPCRWVLFGGDGDTELAAGLASQLEYGLKRLPAEARLGPPRMVLNLAGATSLRELASVLCVCRVLLTNDTGPMHLAAAVGTPVVVPFGSTSPELTGPGLPGDPRHHLLKTDAPCAPCFLRRCPIDLRCLRNQSVESVVQAVLQAAQRTTS